MAEEALDLEGVFEVTRSERPQSDFLPDVFRSRDTSVGIRRESRERKDPIGEAKKKIRQKAAGLPRDGEGNADPEAFELFRKEAESYYLSGEERRAFRTELITFVLTQAESPKPLSIRPVLDVLRAIFGERQAEMAKDLYILYGVLVKKAGYKLSRGEYPPWATVTNMVRIRKAASDWLAQGNRARSEEGQHRLREAHRRLTEFVLQIGGWWELKRNIATDRAVKEIKPLVTELDEKFFALDKQVLVEALREEIQSEEAQADFAFHRAIEVSSLYALGHLKMVMRAWARREALAAEVQKLEVQAPEVPEARDERYERAMALLGLAKEAYDDADALRTGTAEKVIRRDEREDLFRKISVDTKRATALEEQAALILRPKPSDPLEGIL